MPRVEVEWTLVVRRYTICWAGHECRLKGPWSVGLQAIGWTWLGRGTLGVTFIIHRARGRRGSKGLSRSVGLRTIKGEDFQFLIERKRECSEASLVTHPILPHELPCPAVDFQRMCSIELSPGFGASSLL